MFFFFLTSCIEEGSFNLMLGFDCFWQLRIEQQAGRVFKGWEEGRIYFAPTYKYLANSNHYVAQTSNSREKRRTPAW